MFLFNFQKGKSKSGNKEGKNDDNYHSLDEIYNYLTMLEKRYAFVSIDEIGLTFEKRPMKVLKVCSIF